MSYRMTSNRLLNDNINKYRAKLAMSSHMMCCSSEVVGLTHVLSMTRHSLQMTFRATRATLAADSETAVSAMISAWAEPSPPVTDRFMKLSKTMSMSSLTWPMLPQILACIEGYISTSSMVSVINLSRMWATFWRLWSSAGCLQNRVKFSNHGVMYSKHKCFNSIDEALKPWIHSSRNSRVRWGSFWAKVSLMDLIKIVLLDGMQSPLVSKRWPSILRSKVDVKAQSKL